MTSAGFEALVRILDRENRVVGGGLAVSRSQILTCAHVVNRAVGRPQETTEPTPEEISVDFPLASSQWQVETRVVHWRPGLDVAVLEPVLEMPEGVQSAPLVANKDLWGHPIRAFGFPAPSGGFEDGIWISGILRDRQAQGWVQLDCDLRSPPIVPGYSGCPVWDESLEGMVGLIVAIDSRSESRAAFLIPTDTITRFLPVPTRDSASAVGAGIENDAGREGLDEVRQAYLEWVVWRHRRMDLRGVRADGRLLTVPLEKIFVALQGDRANLIERAQARLALEERLEQLARSEQIEPADLQQLLWHVVAGSPLMPSLELRDRLPGTVAEATGTTLGETYARERRVVILGDPGSGKTTLLRWLALNTAQALQDGREWVDIPRSRIFPGSTDETLFRLGRPRLPILVRIAEYVQDRETCKQEGRAPRSLIEFFGDHSWLNSRPVYGPASPGREGETVESERLRELCRDALRWGEALVLLDGLDEIPESTARDEVIDEVDSFLQTWVARRGDALSELPPSRRNRLVVTSRIAGYHASPLKSDLAHVTIEPMQDAALEQFCKTWMVAVHDELRRPGENDRIVHVRAVEKASELRREICNPDRRGVRELATNPLLASLLAALFHQGEKLPRRRVELYEAVVDQLTERWRRRPRQGREEGLDEREIFDVLEPIAFEIHQHKASGLIPENELRDLIREYLGQSRRQDAESPELRRAVRSFFRILRDDVGLLAARGEGVYGFLHLTFEEYLAARFLVRDPARAVGRLLEQIDDPRWREPVLMALGFASLSGPERLQPLLLELLEERGELGRLAPRGVFLIIAALPEMSQVPDEIYGKLYQRLLELYADEDGMGRFGAGRQHIEKAAEDLRRHSRPEVLERSLHQAFREDSADRARLAPAAAQLMRRLGCYSYKLAQDLLDHLDNDSAARGWPIEKALFHQLSSPDSSRPLPPVVGESPIVEAEEQRLLATYDQSRDPEQRRQVRGELLRLALEKAEAEAEETWKTVEYERRREEYQQSLREARPSARAAWLDRLRFRRALERRPALAERVLNDPDWLRLALALYGGLQPFDIANPDLHARTPPPLSVAEIYRDSSLTPHLLEALQDSRQARSLIETFRREWHDGSSAVVRAEALVALVALGDDTVEDLLRVAADQPSQSSILEDIWLRLERLSEALSYPVRQTSPSLASGLKSLAGELDGGLWGDLLAATTATVVTANAWPFDMSGLVEVAPSDQLAGLVGEHLFVQFEGSGEIRGFPDISLIVGRLPEPERVHEVLVQAVAAASGAAHRHARVLLYGWPLPSLESRHLDRGEVPLAILSALGRIDSRASRFRAWVLGRLKPLLDEQPDLGPEILALALADTGESSSPRESLAKLAPELLDEADPHRAVYDRALALTRPAPRARALWRLARISPALRAEALAAAQATVPRVRDPHQRAQILERLIRDLPEEHRPRRIGKLRAAIRAIKNPADRARALGRLAFLLPGDERSKALRQALKTIGKVAEPRERALLLGVFRPLLLPYPELRRTFDDLVGKLAIPLRHVALERWGAVLRTHFDRLAASAEDAVELWAPVSLAASIEELRQALGRSTDPRVLWERLATDPSAEGETILAAARGGQQLVLTPAAALVLDRLLSEGPAELVRKLLPWLSRPQPETLAILERWARHRDDAIASPASLLLAEAEGVSVATLPGVVRLLTGEDDHSRRRAAFVIQHPNVVPARPTRLASLVGGETLEAILAAALRLQPEAPHLARPLRLTLHDVLHDDPSIITSWAQRVQADEGSGEAAELALSQIENVTGLTWQEICARLRGGGARTRIALLKSVFSLRYRDKLTRDQWRDYSRGTRVASAEMREIRVLLADATDVVRVAAEALEWHREEPDRSPVALAEELLENHSSTLFDLLKSENSLETQAPRAVGLNLYQATIDRASFPVDLLEDRPEIPRLLIQWLQAALRGRQQDTDLYRKRGRLLQVVAATAEILPALFARSADGKVLEPLLIETARYYGTAPGRADALFLLGMLRRVTPGVAAAFSRAMLDSPEVRQRALEAIPRFRDVDPEVLRDLRSHLTTESAAASHSWIQILMALGTKARFDPKTRSKVLVSLAEALEDSRSRHLSGFDGGRTEALRPVGRDEEIYRAILALSYD